jgi:hypothetical protein
MGDDRKGEAVTDKTSREILDAIDYAAKETAARAAAGKLDVIGGMLAPPLYLPPSAESEGPKPASAREILEAIDKALEETHRRLAEAEAAVDGTCETSGRT